MDVVVKQEQVSSWPDIELNRACEWCSAPDYMRNQIQEYVEKPLDEWQELLLDLCDCYDCFQEYHRLAEELIERDHHFKKKFQTLDIERLTLTIAKALEGPLEAMPGKLQTPLMEILCYPYLLHHKQLADLFVEGMIAVFKCGFPLKLEDKVPGAYLLLVHPRREVRAWADKVTRGLGLISPDDYDLLVQVIKWMVQIVELGFDIGEPEHKDELPFDYLPTHLYFPLVTRDYWRGLVVLVMRMEVSTLQSCFMSSDDNGHREFLQSILPTMKCQTEEDGTFWHILQCFVALVEKLGERIWQMPEFKSLPGDVFNIITENTIYRNYIQQRQEEREVSPSQEACRDSLRPSHSPSSCRSYKTALAWFKPFVQSLLVFDSGGEHVSEVVRYLHNVADRCSFQSSFRHEVQSSLLTVICDLLTQGLLQLLVPTVRLWAIDMVDVAISGSLDNSSKTEMNEKQRLTFERDRNLQDLLELPVVLRVAQRKLQDILEYCHYRGFNNALKYYELLNRMALPIIPKRDKQEIISLVIQRFEEDTRGPQFLHHPVIQISSSKVQELMESENKKHIIQMPQGSLRTQPNVPLEEVQASVVSEGRRLAHGDAGPIKSLTPEKESKQRKEEQVKVSATSDNQRSVDVNAEVTVPFVTVERRKRKIDPTVRSWGEAGPSSRVSSSEDEVEENEYWAQIKRRKNQKHRDGKFTVSNKSLAMSGSPLQARVQLDDYRRKGKKDKDLLPARKKDVSPTLFKVKTAVKDHHVSVKKETKLKRTFRARKSAGRLKNVASSQQMQGTTSDNPIVLSDEDNADEISVQKEPFSFADMKMIDKSEEWSEGLNEMVGKHSTSQSDVLKLETEIPQSVLSNSSKETIAEIPKDSGEDLFFSVFDEKAASSSSLKTPALDVSFLELKTGKSNSDISHEVRRGRLSKPDTILYPELMDAEENDNVNILAEVDGVMNETSDDKQEILNDESDDKPPNLKVNPVSFLRDEEQTLSSISRQLDNDIDNGINFWDDHSEFIWNSQDNALKSIEDDLEDLDRTHHQDVKSSGSGLDNKPLSQRDHLNKALPSEGADAAKSNVKRVKFGDDVSQADAPASSVATVASLADRPAVTTPGKELTDDEFFREVVSWNVAHLEYPKGKGKNAGLPRNFPVFPMHEKEGFDSMDRYYETLKPLLFMEIWAKAVQDWWNKEGVKKRVFMDVLDGSTLNELSLIPCSGIISQEQNNRTLFPMESDLVVVRFIGSNLRDSEQMKAGLRYGVAVFGVVETAKVKPVQSARRESTGRLGGDDVAEPPKFHLTLNIKTSSKFRPPRKSCLQVEYVTSLLTALRQWVGLMNIPKSLLACDILKPRKADYFCLNDPHSSIDSKEYNESQKKVISTAANAVHLPYPIPRICLVQGPPGTGKSKTIVGLVKEILNRPRDLPPPTTAGPAVLANKCRVLLCAPSNAAIDELIGQIEGAQIRLDKTHNNKENRRSNHQRGYKEGTFNNCGDLCLVRVGRKSQVHSSVARFWLDNLTKEAQSKSSTSSVIIPAIKEEIRVCDASQTKLEQQIWHLKNFGPDNVIELNELEDQMTSLKNRKKALQIKYRMEKDKQSNLRREEARIRRKILDSAHIICTTLSGSGSTTLKNDLGRRHLPFTCVIVDEACQSTELDLLIPLGFKASKLVLVGDPEQLPPTVLSEKAKTNSFDRSMFQRLQRFFRHHEMGRPVFMLEEQYRMHPQIAAFPSRHVYSGRLKSHSSLETRPFPLKTRYAVFDVYRGQEICQEKGSLQNRTEVALIVHLCTFLTKVLHQESVGIITPYRKQKAEIEKRLKDWDLPKIEVDTVDGFQGREKDVIILSCVRAKSNHGSIGFVSDKRRMNVALTRARHALYVFGDMETLKRSLETKMAENGDIVESPKGYLQCRVINGSKDWKALIADAVRRKCIFRDQFAQDVVSRLSIASTNDDRSPAKDLLFKTKVPSARGSDAPTCNEHGSLLEMPDTLIHCDEKVDDKDISALPKKALSVSVSEKHKSVPVMVKGKALVKTGGGALNRKKVTWADSSDQKSTDGPGKPEAKERAKNAVSEVKRGKQADTSRHSHHQKNLQDRHDTIRHTHNDQGHNHRHHGDRQSSKGEHSASLSDVQERVGTDAAEQQGDANHSSNSERRRYRQDKEDHVAMGTVSNTKEMDCSRTFDMAVRKSSFAENDQSSSTTRSLYGNSISNGEQINDDTSHVDTEDCTRDPVLTSVIENNRSHPAGYYVQLHQQETRSGERLPAVVTSSVSRRLSTETASNSTLPRTPLPYSGQSLAKLSSSHLTRSATRLVPSTSAVSGVSLEGSRPSSSFGAAEPSNEEASSTSHQSSPGLGSRTMRAVVSQHQLPRDIQEKVDAVRQRHPLPRGPQIIEARALTGLRNPYGSAKRRTAHNQGRDDSSLRERALDGPLRTERRNSNAGPRIDKTKYSKNFRGRINWHSR